MGNSNSSSASGGGSLPGPQHTQQQGGADQASGCPVLHKRKQPAAEEQGSSACPVGHGRQQKVYNVYSQEINPDNNMPFNANQLPAPGQTKPLSTDRVTSGIPKGGTDGTWTYPSQQMFYNALKRKGKGSDVKEDDMASIIAVHNNMNERSWIKLMEWEKMHCKECADPKLLRFTGRPDELTPKAWLKHHILGHPKPFDRHDWTIDRCGKEVRYVLDYYYNESLGEQDQMPGLRDMHSVKSITFDVRPALDSPEAFMDRMRMASSRWFSTSAAGAQGAGAGSTTSAVAATSKSR